MMRLAPDGDDPQALRQHVAWLEQELALAREERQLYHRVMGWLRDMDRPHGQCEPRSRRACTHCNAKEHLQALRDGYRGQRILPAAGPRPSASPEPPCDCGLGHGTHRGDCAVMVHQDARVGENDEAIRDGEEAVTGRRPDAVTPCQRRAFRYGAQAERRRLLGTP